MNSLWTKRALLTNPLRLATPVSTSTTTTTTAMAPSASFTTSAPAAQTSELAAFGEQHVARGVSRLTTNVLKKGSGAWVWNDQGRKLLDLTCGIGVTNLGHCHPRVSEAAKAQVDQIVHAQCAIGYSEKYLELIRAMLPTFAKIDPRLDSVFFWNSGSEAVEASIKLAREVTGKNNVIVVQGECASPDLSVAADGETNMKLTIIL